jgi:hypothetical protein
MNLGTLRRNQSLERFDATFRENGILGSEWLLPLLAHRTDMAKQQLHIYH